MSKIKEAKETKVFVIENNEVVETTYYDHVMVSEDITTTPNGVGGRKFVEEVELSLDKDDFDEEQNYLGNEIVPSFFKQRFNGKLNLGHFDNNQFSYDAIYYCISTWGANGNRFKSGRNGLDIFLKEEDAEDFLFEQVENYNFNKDDQRDTRYFHSEEEAFSELHDIDLNVAKSILRKKHILVSKRKEKALKLKLEHEEWLLNQARQYVGLIEPKKETFKETAKRLSFAINNKIDKKVFYKAVSLIRTV